LRLSGNTRSNRLATTKQVIVFLAMMCPLGVLVMFAAETWMKGRLGLEVDWEDELVRSLYGTAITLASMGLMLFCVERVGAALTRRRGEVEPPESP
jgi:hypothetical protein